MELAQTACREGPTFLGVIVVSVVWLAAGVLWFRFVDPVLTERKRKRLEAERKRG